MFKTFAATLATLAAANEPTMIESKISHFSQANSIVIQQDDDEGIFNLNPTFTYASPDPVVSPGTEQFHVQGAFQTDPMLDHVNFTCHLFGVKVYDQDITCLGPDPSGSSCPTPAGPYPSNWQGDFLFEVPSGAPTGIDYDIKVEGKTAAGEKVFELSTTFTI